MPRPRAGGCPWADVTPTTTTTTVMTASMDTRSRSIRVEYMCPLLARSSSMRPVFLHAHVVPIVRQIRENRPAKFQHVERSELLIHDVTVRRDDQRERHSGGHQRVERGLHLVGLRRRKQQIAIRGLVLAQEFEHQLALLRLILGHAD